MVSNPLLLKFILLLLLVVAAATYSNDGFLNEQQDLKLWTFNNPRGVSIEEGKLKLSVVDALATPQRFIGYKLLNHSFAFQSEEPLIIQTRIRVNSNATVFVGFCSNKTLLDPPVPQVGLRFESNAVKAVFFASNNQPTAKLFRLGDISDTFDHVYTLSYLNNSLRLSMDGNTHPSVAPSFTSNEEGVYGSGYAMNDLVCIDVLMKPHGLCVIDHLMTTNDTQHALDEEKKLISKKDDHGIPPSIIITLLVIIAIYLFEALWTCLSLPFIPEIYLNKLEREKQLGEGAGGTVYGVKHNGIGYAAKMSKEKNTLRKEAHFLVKAGLHQEGSFVQSRYLVKCKNELFLLMDLMDEHLGSYIRKLNKDEQYITKVTKILVEVACGLERLHERQRLHLDIKLENILVKKEPSLAGLIVKIGDFGSAEIYTEWKATKKIDHYNSSACKEYATDVEAFGKVINGVIQGAPARSELVELQALANSCTNSEAKQRPSMSAVRVELGNILKKINGTL